MARVNEYDVRIAHTKGDHVWHVHDDTDEFFLVLEGHFDIATRNADGSEDTVVLRAGDTFVVRRGTEHKPSSTGGAVLLFEPSGTSSTGDHHEGDIPNHVDTTTGHTLSQPAAEWPAARSRTAEEPLRRRALTVPPVQPSPAEWHGRTRAGARLRADREFCSRQGRRSLSEQAARTLATLPLTRR